MAIIRKLGAKKIALTACFAGLYVVLSFLPMFRLIGFFGPSITAATVLAPIIGIILGVYLGVLSTLLGGIIGLLLSSSFPLFSLPAGIVGALCAALLFQGRRKLCTLLYLTLLLAFGLFPQVGPAWVYPPYMLFQTVGFIILISPIQSYASKYFMSDTPKKLFFAFFTTSLTSTLASQIAGTFAYEIVTDPRGSWFPLAFIYPIERTTIAFIAAFVGTSLFKTLKNTDIIHIRQAKLHSMPFTNTYDAGN